MGRFIKSFVILFIAVALVSAPLGSAFAAEETSFDEVTETAMIFDATIVRPLGAVSIVVGTAFFVVSSPFAAMGGNIGQSYEKLVKNPVTFTFTRPLGEF